MEILKYVDFIASTHYQLEKIELFVPIFVCKKSEDNEMQRLSLSHIYILYISIDFVKIV